MENNNITPVCGFYDINNRFFEKEEDALRSTIVFKVGKIFRQAEEELQGNIPAYIQRGYEVRPVIYALLSSKESIQDLLRLEEIIKSQISENPEIIEQVIRKDNFISLMWEKIKERFNGKS